MQTWWPHLVKPGSDLGAAEIQKPPLAKSEVVSRNTRTHTTQAMGQRIGKYKLDFEVPVVVTHHGASDNRDTATYRSPYEPKCVAVHAIWASTHARVSSESGSSSQRYGSATAVPDK